MFSQFCVVTIASDYARQLLLLQLPWSSCFTILLRIEWIQDFTGVKDSDQHVFMSFIATNMSVAMDLMFLGIGFLHSVYVH